MVVYEALKRRCNDIHIMTTFSILHVVLEWQFMDAMRFLMRPLEYEKTTLNYGPHFPTSSYLSRHEGPKQEQN